MKEKENEEGEEERKRELIKPGGRGKEGYEKDRGQTLLIKDKNIFQKFSIFVWDKKYPQKGEKLSP